VSKLRRKIPVFRPTISLEQGLNEMIEWYERNRRSGAFADGRSSARRDRELQPRS
jgi:dTDP-D-glucose 4,6-dehydratase